MKLKELLDILPNDLMITIQDEMFAYSKDTLRKDLKYFEIEPIDKMPVEKIDIENNQLIISIDYQNDISTQED